MSAASSGGKKKRPAVVQCRHCGCFCLAKDVESHSGGSMHGTPDLTPKQATVQRRRPGRQSAPEKSVAENGHRQSSVSNNISSNHRRCNGFLNSSVPLIEPRRGLALAETAMDEKWAQKFPVELHGWQRRHSALVRSETLSMVGALPRSAFLVLAASDKLAQKRQDLITLWPSDEVPALRIAFPPLHSLDTINISCASSSHTTANDEKQQPLLRLRLIRSFGSPLIKVLLRPNLGGTDIPLGHWARLAKLTYFPQLLRAYFSNALLCTTSADGNLARLEMFYYGQRLLFHIVQFECEQPTGVDGMEGTTASTISIEQQMQKSCTLQDDVNGTYAATNGDIAGEEESSELPSVHRVSPFCLFEFDWSAVPKLEHHKTLDESEEDELDESLL